jgi:iron(III) transport system ATP-binding protein
VATPFGTFPAPGHADGTAATIAIRLQGFRLGPPGTGAPGRVLRRRFLGEVALVDIAVEGLEAPLKARLRENEPVAPGLDVGVSVEPRDVLVFAR